MNARTILARVIERMFPERVARYKQMRREQRTAMQAMLDESKRMRESGCNTERINNRLFSAMYFYKRGDYRKCALCATK